MAGFTTAVLATFRSVFDTTSVNLYKIRAQLYAVDATGTTNAINVWTTTYDGSVITENIYSISATYEQWYPIEIDYTTDPVTNSTHKGLRFGFGRSLNSTGTFIMHVKNLRVEKVVKAEVQDSDIVGRRFYEGTKMSSTDINIDSPDTIDGGPVITVNTVASSTPTFNPLGVSGPAATMTQQQQTGEA